MKKNDPLKKAVWFGKRGHDHSVLTLFMANLATILFAMVEHWDVSTTLWIYWWQSVIIGMGNFITMRSLHDFSTEGFSLGDGALEPTEKTKKRVSYFFAFHYGFFHLVYMVFLLANGSSTGKPSESRYILISAGIFLLHHAFDLWSGRKRLPLGPNIGTLMFMPYARIIPMHLTIILGGFLMGGRSGDNNDTLLLIFMGLKALVDVMMHIILGRRR